MAADSQLIFIGGLHRSGTSPLFKALRERPEVGAFRDTGVPEDEGQHLQDVYPSARAHGGPGLFGFNPASHLTEDSPLAAPENARRILECWGRHWDASRPILIEKSPPNLLMTRFLRRLFPGSRFLIVMRNPIAVSLATQKWSGTSIPSLVAHWTACHEIFRADARALAAPGRADGIKIVAYERLVRVPAATLAEIHEWMGLAPAPPPFDLTGEANARYFERFGEMAAADPSLAPELEREFGSRVRALGYDLANFAQADPEGALGWGDRLG